MRSDSATLLDVARAARSIIAFTRGMDRAAFAQDEKTQSAVLYQILILGEAVKRLSSGFRSQHPEISWSLIAGMRDRVIHDYDHVDLERVWFAVERHVPSLLAYVEPLLPAEED